jgi:hypothetical protein
MFKIAGYRYFRTLTPFSGLMQLAAPHHTGKAIAGYSLAIAGYFKLSADHDDARDFGFGVCGLCFGFWYYVHVVGWAAEVAAYVNGTS